MQSLKDNNTVKLQHNLKCSSVAKQNCE